MSIDPELKSKLSEWMLKNDWKLVCGNCSFTEAWKRTLADGIKCKRKELIDVYTEPDVEVKWNPNNRTPYYERVASKGTKSWERIMMKARGSKDEYEAAARIGTKNLYVARMALKSLPSGLKGGNYVEGE